MKWEILYQQRKNNLSSIIQIKYMFLFQCCQTAQSGRGYVVKKRNKNNEEVVTFISSLADVDAKELKDPSIQVIKIEKSEYDELIKQYSGTTKKWTDPFFQPSEESLGVIKDVETSQWKRISDILNKPALFDGKIEPKDVIQGSLGDCYFLSALAALAEDESRIRTIFGNQTFSPNGIYKVVLRIDGVIQEIIVDDFIPVNKRSEPLFCQPNKNQFWVLILQKAWAKAHGSYANIVSGNPTQVFKAVTYAPAEMLLVKEGEDERERLWKVIFEHSKNNHPCCCGTDDRNDIDWQKIGLVAGHAYTLIDADVVETKNDQEVKMLVFRNPWGDTEWQGEGCEKDEEFWANIKPSQEKNKFLQNCEKVNDGIFFMTYPDFCKYFSQTHFCLLHRNGNYICEDLFPNGKNGNLFTFEIETSGQYTFELHQEGIRGEDQQKIEEGLCRSTILIGKKEENDFKFIDGALKYNDEDTTLKTYLYPGSYIFYAKLDPTRKSSIMPTKTSVSVYSKQFTDLIPADQKSYPNFLKKIFLNHAKLNKRQTYNNDQMWISWKLLFQQGGYAYVALGNSSESKKNFVVQFDQSAFNQMNYELKKGFKGRGNGQKVVVRPGEEEIILTRVKNISLTSLKFPPKLNISVEKIGHE